MIVHINSRFALNQERLDQLSLVPESNEDYNTLEKLVSKYCAIGMGRDSDGKIVHAQLALEEISNQTIG